MIRRVFTCMLVGGVLMGSLAFANESDHVIAVTGRLRSHGVPVAGAGVLLHIGNPDEACAGPPIAVSDSQGQFSFRQRIPRAWQESFAVVVRTFRLCIREKDTWADVWTMRSGPPPKELSLDCELFSPVARKCSTRWDGKEIE